MKRIDNVLVCGKKIIKKDNDFYIAFCNYNAHRGIIINEDKCLDRACIHYQKLYIKK
jgi:hypothetical protein